MKIFRVIAPFGNAFDRTVKKLFQPFSLIFFLKLAFIAWLANLGTNTNAPIGYHDLRDLFDSFEKTKVSCPYDSIQRKADSSVKTEKIVFGQPEKGKAAAAAKSNVTTANAPDCAPSPAPAGKSFRISPLLLFLLIPVFLLILLLVLLMIWLLSRGKIMFLQTLARRANEVSIRQEWKQSGRQGNSLFRYTVVVTALWVLFVTTFCPAAYYLLNPITKNWISIPSFPLAPATVAVVIVLLFIVALPVSIFLFAFHEFGPILMIRNNLYAWPAFQQICALTLKHLWPVLKYLIFLILLYFVFGVALVVFVVITCCLWCIWIALAYLPFLWAVVFLPVLTCRQYIAMEFARQFGPDYDLFEQDPPPEEPQGNPPEEPQEPKRVIPLISLED